MAEGEGAVYNSFKADVLKGDFDLVNDTVKISLVSGYTPDIDSDDDWSDVSVNEFGTTGNYTAKTLAGKAVTQDNTNDLGKFDANDVTWSSLNLGGASESPSHAVVWDDTHDTDGLVCYWEVTTASDGSNYVIQFGSGGILTLA